MQKQTYWLTVMLVAGLAGPILAAVDIVTLPTRDGTQLTIYNSEDITMVREYRLLTVKVRGRTGKRLPSINHQPCGRRLIASPSFNCKPIQRQQFPCVRGIA